MHLNSWKLYFIWICYINIIQTQHSTIHIQLIFVKLSKWTIQFNKLSRIQTPCMCCTWKIYQYFLFFIFIFQFGTPWADGTAAISQCAINPGETFVYNFIVDKVRRTTLSHTHTQTNNDSFNSSTAFIEIILSLNTSLL